MKKHSEGLKIARLLMVFSSFSPLFILWAVRGNCLVPDNLFIGICLMMVILPNASLLLRIHIAKKNNDKKEIVIGTADDHRDHILVYLFAMLLPFYSESIGSIRDFVATLVALLFIVFLFWYLNLHYMNLLFAFLGYRVFTINPPIDNNPLLGKMRCVLITRREHIVSGERFIGYRLSNTVYLEVNT
jgi:hypothetical protein